MKKLISFFTLLVSVTAFAQNNDKPFASIGKEGELLSLSNGRYEEVFKNDKFRRVGSVMMNTETMKIDHFLTEEELKECQDLETEKQASRFLSIDPLTRSFPFYTPYQYAGNKPIACIDLDGLEDVYYLPSMIRDQGEASVKMLESTEIGGEIMNKFRDPNVNKGYDVFIKKKLLSGNTGAETDVTIDKDNPFKGNYLKALYQAIQEGESNENYNFFNDVFGEEFMKYGGDDLKKTIDNGRGLIIINERGDPNGEGMAADNFGGIGAGAKLIGHEFGSHILNDIQGIDKPGDLEELDFNGVKAVSTYPIPDSKQDKLNKQVDEKVKGLKNEK